VTNYVVPLYFCPSVGVIRQNSFDDGGGDADIRTANDYLGNGGTVFNYDGFTRTPSDPFDGPLVPATRLSHLKVRLSDIKDGTSETMLVGEKYLYHESFLGQTYCAEDQGWVDGFDNDTMGFAQGYHFGASTPPQHFDPSTPSSEGPGGGNLCGSAFGSIHLSAMNCVFCDGSVHSVNFTIDPVTWQRLCSALDGQPTGTVGWE